MWILGLSNTKRVKYTMNWLFIIYTRVVPFALRSFSTGLEVRWTIMWQLRTCFAFALVLYWSSLFIYGTGCKVWGYDGCGYEVLSSEMWCPVAWWGFTKVSEEHTASIFRAEEWAKQANKRATSLEFTAFCLLVCLLGLLFGPEDGGSTFLWNVGELVSDFTVSI
jgi:hypothetical protein